jgi:thiol:disulfide interchange protein DsbA
MRLTALTGLFALLLTTLTAHAEPWVELATPQPTRDPAKVEVIEFFWYGCPHCYHAEPRIAAWRAQLPEQVEFIRVPAVFNARWAVLARAYYAMQQLGLGEEVHRALFDAIHRERLNLDDEASLAKFFAARGVPEQAFRDAFNSFDVDRKVRQANQMTRDYGLEGVPTFVVEGTYRVDGTTAGSEDNMFDALDRLVAQAIKTKG